jgi:hypothetical protein
MTTTLDQALEQACQAYHEACVARGLTAHAPTEATPQDVQELYNRVVHAAQAKRRTMLGEVE